MVIFWDKNFYGGRPGGAGGGPPLVDVIGGRRKRKGGREGGGGWGGRGRVLYILSGPWTCHCQGLISPLAVPLYYDLHPLLISPLSLSSSHSSLSLSLQLWRRRRSSKRVPLKVWNLCQFFFFFFFGLNFDYSQKPFSQFSLMLI